MVFGDEYKPVSKPIKKVGAELQASGIYFFSNVQRCHKFDFDSLSFSLLQHIPQNIVILLFILVQ